MPLSTERCHAGNASYGFNLPVASSCITAVLPLPLSSIKHQMFTWLLCERSSALQGRPLSLIHTLIYTIPMQSKNLTNKKINLNTVHMHSAIFYIALFYLVREGEHKAIIFRSNDIKKKKRMK